MKKTQVRPSLGQKTTPSTSDDVIEALHIWGQYPLQGHITVSGAKNSALALMAGTLLCPEYCRFTNVPSLRDIERMSQVLTALGAKVETQGSVIDIDTSNIITSKAPYELVSKLRASFFVLGPLVARLGEAKVPLPGGCAIGARPVELHVKGLELLGAEVRIEHGIVYAEVKGNGGRLKGAKIYLDYPSVGATETLMMAATLADGETIIENAAQEPEVEDLANFCRSMGAKIRGAGTNTIIVVGVPELHATEYPIIPDRIEAGTFLVAGAMTRSELTLSPVVPEHLTPLISKLEAAGSQVIIEGTNQVRIVPGEVIKSTDIETLPYPGFPTDMQAQFMSLMAISEGNSVVTETVFENRLRHVGELVRMGADIKLKGNNAFIKGVKRLSGAPVTGTDLRASAALVVAGLAAEGETLVKGLHHLDRGYENIEEKLRKVGAKLERITITE